MIQGVPTLRYSFCLLLSFLWVEALLTREWREMHVAITRHYSLYGAWLFLRQRQRAQFTHSTTSKGTRWISSSPYITAWCVGPNQSTRCLLRMVTWWDKVISWRRLVSRYVLTHVMHVIDIMPGQDMAARLPIPWRLYPCPMEGWSSPCAHFPTLK